MTTGRISSFQSMGAVDGPGLRSVVFMQGCSLRCAYCHNPETWSLEGGEVITVEELLRKIERYRPYIQESGGVTISGGEPLLQWNFVRELFCKLKERGYHTTLDTSGIGDLHGAKEVLHYTDLVLADLKFTDAHDFQTYCAGDLQRVYDFLALTAKMDIPLWLRQVIVPGINDNEEQVRRLKEAASCYPNVERIELLPFRSLCVPKYQELGLTFPLLSTPDCSPLTIKALEAHLYG